MVKIIKGKGKGHSFTFPFGTQSANLSEEHKGMTIEEIAVALLRQGSVTDGDIEIDSINFRIYKAKES